MRQELILRWTLRIGLILAFIYNFMQGHMIGMLGGTAIFISTIAIAIINRKKEIISYEVSSMYYCFCFFAVVFGVMLNFYDYISWWDLLMHLFSGILLGVVGKWILDKSMRKARISPVVIFFFVLGIACIGGVVWEMYEFSIDSLFNLDTQVSSITGVSDTMGDLITDFFGGLIASIYYGFIKR